MSEPPGQIRADVADPEGGSSTVISSARVVEQEARSVLVLAEGLFRLDVIPRDDMIQTVLRSLDPERMLRLREARIQGANEASGDLAPSTGRFGGEVVLVDRGERPVASLLVGSVFYPDRGETSFTALARIL